MVVKIPQRCMVEGDGLVKRFRIEGPLSRFDEWKGDVINFKWFMSLFRRRGLGDVITALDKVSFKVERGAICGVLGPNGAGKTTLIKILCGLLTPDEGRVFINGFDVVKDWRKVKGYVNLVVGSSALGFQDVLSVGANLEYWCTVYRMSASEVQPRIREVLEFVGLSDKVHEKYMNLSSGMRQKLVFARGLLTDAEVWLLDEPTIHLDPMAASDARRFIKDELNRKHGATVILATQNMYEASLLCHKVMLLNKGRMVLFDSPSNIVSKLSGYDTCIRLISSKQIESTSFHMLKESISSAKELELDGLELRIYTSSPVKTLIELTPFIREGCLNVVDVSMEKPTLEEAFIRLLRSG